MERLGFFLYILFTASWFLHLTSRLPFLGAVRFDLLLVVALGVIYFAAGEKKNYAGNPCYQRLLWLIMFALVAIPFSEWPGSVLRFGIPNFIKAVVFFFFTIWFVTTEKRLKIFMASFILFQSLRVLEPLYLHITEGYWGSAASMGNWDSMNRLAGAPYDVINPNGLAFVILTITPFLLVLSRENKRWMLYTLAVAPPSLYALYLTGSRSGMLGLLVLLLIYVYQSKKKVLIGSILIIGGFIAASSMEGNFKDRYLSIISSDTSNAATAEGRITGIKDDFQVAMRKPLFGHGLGTSKEANANFGSRYQISHNVYTETAQEIGFIGLVFFLMFVWAVVKNNWIISKYDGDSYLIKLSKAVFIFAGMNVFFGLASYGLSSYEWYLLAALTVVMYDHLRRNADAKRGISGDERPYARKLMTHPEKI